jgi:ribosomal protein S18 acetylase RimI-like enzyme
MIIRSTKKEDFERWFRLRKQLFESEMKIAKADTFIKFYIEKPIKKQQQKEFSKMLGKEDSIFIVAEEKKNLIGYLFGFLNYYKIHNLRRKFGYLDTMVVLKNYRDRGVGKKLHNKFIKWLKSKKIKWAVLRVDNSNIAGRKFYKKERYYPTELRMVKRI